MKKSEIIKFLKILRKQFPNDIQAAAAINYLMEKSDSLVEEEVNRVVKEEGFILPDELRELERAFAIFADGACRGNPGPGAWATLIQNASGDILLKSSGVDMPTTNNKMELEGVIRGLKGLIEKWEDDGIADNETPVFVYSDSKYVVDGITSWVPGWKAKGWLKADKKEPENLVLWKELDFLKSRFSNVTFIWVKGHAGHPQNEFCDSLANLALDEAGF